MDRLPLFREAFAKRRCLIPATGFYEWQKLEDGKQPYRFRRKDLEPFAFAGIWEFARLAGEEILSAAVIAGETNPRHMTRIRSIVSTQRPPWLIREVCFPFRSRHAQPGRTMGL